MMMNVCIKMMNFVLKMMKFVLKRMNIALQHACRSKVEERLIVYQK